MVQRTIDLLPEIFRTDTNRKFFSATLDQLTQEPRLKKTQGYVGRRVGPGVNPADKYVTEPSAVRTDYQLEPGVVFFKPDTNTAQDAITYPGIIDALDLQGANTQKQDRLFQSQYYTWDPFCDLDKFTNYSQYYWLPNGPDSVDVSSVQIPLTDSWDVTRVVDTETHAYQFSNTQGNNPVITLVRGGNYEFNVNQPGHNFWIQAFPGVNGRLPTAPNISSRDVLGVTNNGEDGGTVSFDVPLKNAQDFYYTLTDLGTVDLLTDLKFDQINNIYVDQFLAQYPTGIDGITNLNGRTIVFTNQIPDPSDGGWGITTQFDPLVRTAPNQVGASVSYDLTSQPYDDVSFETISNIILSGSPDNLDGYPGSYDSLLFDQVTYITDQALRYSVWQIQYITDNDGRQYMRLSSIMSVPNLNKFTIAFGNQWSNTQWYKNASGFFQQIPLLTAVLDTLYYQDSTDPEIFGQIRLVDEDVGAPIDINDIIGAKDYTSPNGVTFTNGLKVQFRGFVYPAQFQNLEYYVEGVGTGLGIDARVGFIDGEGYFGPWHYYLGKKLTGLEHSDEVFQQYIYETVEESLEFPNSGYPVGAPVPSTPIAGATTGNGIRLLPVSSFVTPELYTSSQSNPYDLEPYDSVPYDESLSSPTVQDYITINRASRDLNAWSRSNRWFHIDVISATAQYNNQVVILDNNARGKRPIIEFRANLELYNFGTQGKGPINVIDFKETDAFSNINGQLGYSIDGYQFINGTRVIFAADYDPLVRNQIWEVKFIDPNDSGTQIIDLVPVYSGLALVNQTVVCLNGNNLQGQSFWFDGANWNAAQEKTSPNQAPLFNVRNAQGVSLSNREVYPSTTFTGSRLFGYAVGNTDTSDEVLGFALKYLNINNVGDIVFDNYFYNDTFIYVRDSVSYQTTISNGFVREYVDRTLFSNLLGWQTSIAENRSRQIFRFVYDGSPLILDVPVVIDSPFPPLQVYTGGKFIDPTRYTVAVTDTSTTVTITPLYGVPATGEIIEVQALSNVASRVAYYEVPLNLENNPLNENSTGFTLGTIRNHYNSIGENLKHISGPINGANNTRDLGNILRYGDLIVQNSSPLTLTGVFLRDPQYDIFNSLRFNSQEYEKYKSLLLDLSTRGNFVAYTPTQVLDQVMTEISAGKSSLSAFYWSDMVPAGETYTENVYTVTPISTSTFDTTTVYDFTSSNFKGLLVYLNGTLLTKGYEYTVGVNAPTITITVALSVGDVVTIREYATTYGTFVPNTPTKMGLYPAFKPAIFLDPNTVNPTMVIQGHDGSITRAFGDYRDQVLLEFETRIFDNLKIATPVPMTAAEVIPGQFRTTDYTLDEINSILATDFLSWVGWNKLDYVTQNYINTNEFTWNYSQSGDRLTNKPLLGNWRGIYQYFYDTTTPNTTPWEMLGFSEQPDWWEVEYGPAPYTSGNLVLWDDLEQGIVRAPTGTYVLPQYRRPGLSRVIPSDSEGNLLSPLNATVGNYDSTSFRRSWVFGDEGPVEASWRDSSSWPFAVMRLLALTKPAKFFSLFADRDRYVFDSALDQYLWDDRYRLNAKNMSPLYGDGTSKASYLDWIIDYNRQLGNTSTADLTVRLSNIGVRLCWRLAAFSDKKYLKIYTERSTPNSLNTSLLLPDESYQLLLYKDQPFERLTYSSVIVQKTDSGYAVLGYSSTQPYFEILASMPNGTQTIVTVGEKTVRLATEYTNNIIKVPYGYVFNNDTAVCDFLLSYGKLLQDKGMVFDTKENGYVVDWAQMAQEFLYWSQQGWATGSMINLNPGANRLSVTRAQSIVDSIAKPTPENIILNQNRQALPAGDLVIDRLDNVFNITSLTSNTISYANLKFTAYEHIVILDNVSIFADLIYDPITAARQSRVLVSGWLTADWTGLVDAPGFILNQNNVQEWTPNYKYAKGEIVIFKNEYWSASTIIQPSETFDFNLWIKSDYAQIQKGLLPNAANASDQLAQAYSVYNANLENEVDLFSYGLIGFRSREYMKALNLNDVSQVGLYQQFLGIKGTTRSAELFSLANLGKETAQYDIYEYWAMLQASYGATANRSYIDLLLNEALLKSDPSLIQVINPGTTSPADQTVLLDNVWKSSYKLTSPDFLPVTTSPVADIGLPSAGYVNLNDVDITTFDLENTLAVNANFNNIGVGTTIWVAKTNDYDWNIYRAEKVPGAITIVADNLDGKALVTFNAQHGLTTGEILIIRFFSEPINGVYRVLSTPSIDTVLIEYTFAQGSTFVEGDGTGFTLQQARVAQPSDIDTLPYAKQIVPGAKVWVDNDGSGKWTVLEKTDPFINGRSIAPQVDGGAQRFGSAISQGIGNFNALVGAPEYNSGDGALYTYVKDYNNQYQPAAAAQLLSAVNAQGYGNALDIGYINWAIVGAAASNNDQGYAVVIYNPPGSNVFEQRQLLLAPDQDFGRGEFGHSVTMSQDERWLYVTAPAHNKVYAYGRVDLEQQKVEYRTDGVTSVFSFQGYIVDDVQDDQITVVLNNVVLRAENLPYDNGQYQVIGNNVVLNFVPDKNQLLVIGRRNTAFLDVYNYINVSATGGTGSSALFNVNSTRGTYSPALASAGAGYTVGDTLTIAGSALGGTDGVNDLVLEVTATQSYPTGPITLFNVVSGSGVDDTARFPLNQYLYTATNIFSFTVVVNDVLYRPFLDYDIDFDSSLPLQIEFNNLANFPPPGANITVTSKSYWESDPTFVIDGSDISPALPEGARFGQSVSTTTDGRQILIGAPGIDNSSGSVYLYARSVQSFQVTDASVLTYTTEQLPVGPVSVSINGTFLLNSDQFLDGQYQVSGYDIILNSNVTLHVGDIITVDTNHFNFVQEITAAAPEEKSEFGYVVDQCVNNCSLYVGAPFDSTIIHEGGRAEYYQNQARVYGVITTNVANPTLTPGDYLNIDTFLIPVVAPETWSSGSAWAAGTYVTSSGNIYRAVRNVPVGVAITTTSYWRASGWVEMYAAQITASTLPNVIATPVADSVHIADGINKVFNVGNIYSSAEGGGTTLVFVNNVKQTGGVNYTYDATTKDITFVTAPTRGSEIVAVAGRMTISVKNLEASVPLSRLQIMPGTGSVFDDLGFYIYKNQQVIRPPVAQTHANFGKSLSISDNTVTLLIGAPKGSTLKVTTFDNGTTYFDARSTSFLDSVNQSGVAYVYDFLPSTNPSVNNPGQFIFGQQIYHNDLEELSEFGSALDYTTGTLLIGSPTAPISVASTYKYGQVEEFFNINQSPAWLPIRVQQPVVDVALLNTVYMYDRVTGGPKQYFDYFNPLQGRLLGAVRQNIDYIGAVDPAAYNVGEINNYGQHWTQPYVGQIWWNTSNTRFIDPNQDDETYASRRWGQVFPGSQVQVYQWVASDVPPINYTGPGTPLSNTSYSVTSSVSSQGLFGTTYFFWVIGIDTVNTTANKTLSTATIARYIEEPRSSGIAYIAPINASTIAIYNGKQYISSQDTVLHVEFDQEFNEDAVHVQYQLIPQDRADGFLSAALYQKLQDSFCGVDPTGAPVPDPLLPPSELYGVQFRPRQSLFANRFLALENYLKRTNTVLAQYPIVENRQFTLLNSRDPEPSTSSGAWDKRVANIEELSYQDLAQVPVGYRYLVANDSTNNGLWTIYQVIAGALIGSKSLTLIRVQTYDTRQYWSYIDWYLPGYNPLTRPIDEVPNYTALTTLNLPNGSVVKVTANGQGKFEIYQLTDGTWVRVALQDGTIEFSAGLWDYSIGRFGFDIEVFDAQYFDQTPVIETRKIIQSINQELFIDDLAIERNRLLTLMFNYILSEQVAPEWLTKTSLIDVDHTIRELVPFQIYRRDNQDFVLNYIQEVKPYHVQIRQFNLIYNGFDQYNGSMTDFDVPAYYDTAAARFISPVLDDTGTLSTYASVPSTSPLWQTFPYSQWYQNYLLEIEGVTVIDGGSGYTVAPDVVVTGDCVTPAVMYARINSAGKVVSVIVEDPGQGYTTTAIITITGGNGSGAQAVAVMGNGLVRNLNTTIRFDRYQYQTTILDWQANVEYTTGTLVRYDDRVWSAKTTVDSSSFDPEQWNLVNPGTIELEYVPWDPATQQGGYYLPVQLTSGVDRTMGFYVPEPNQPGLDLALLISGVDYPGVQVYGPNFNQDSGFDVGNYDINPYDNISYGPEGRPTYDPAILDAIYESRFVDPYLGVGPAAIDVSGGAFVDTYSSHAPEELVPGAIFDTLDIRVFTTPGADWDGNGHGFALANIAYEFTIPGTSYSYLDIVEFPAAIKVFNRTIGIELALDVDYTIDWVEQKVTINSNVSLGEVIVITAYEVGGGNQIYRNMYNGADVGNSIIVPITAEIIASSVIFVNGVVVNNYTITANDTTSSRITFTAPWSSTDEILVVLFGVDGNYSWSTPVTQYFVSAGETIYTLTNSLSGTNPANIIVEKNGIRARPAEGVEYIADGSSLQYYLPTRGGYSQSLIADNEVAVYIDTVPLTLGVDFELDPYVPGQDRTVTLTNLPAPGDKILISVNTAAQYYISGDTVIWRTSGGFVPIEGDIISVTTWNDTSQQDIITEVFVGPTTSGIAVTEPYDSTPYDSGTVNGDPGSFDWSEGLVIQTNVFDTGRIITDASRIMVSLNGFYIFQGNTYTIDSQITVDGSSIIIAGPPIASTDVVAITIFTNSTVPDGIGFRIFQDMRGQQTSYRITQSTTTYLASALSATDDIIYVVDASKLSEPNLPAGIFGLITIDGERISYRNRDLENNTVSGLRRGTAGTAADAHDVDAPVYDIGVGNILPLEYQDYIQAQNFLGDNSTTTFVATEITIEGLDSTELTEAIEVYIGGIKQTSGYTITNGSPVTVEFTTAPTLGYQVSIRVRKGLSWYQPGPGTPSDGVALQETNTQAARFIRGN